MSIGWKSLRGFLALTSLSILGSACQQENGLTAPENNSAMSKPWSLAIADIFSRSAARSSLCFSALSRAISASNFVNSA